MTFNEREQKHFKNGQRICICPDHARTVSGPWSDSDRNVRGPWPDREQTVNGPWADHERNVSEPLAYSYKESGNELRNTST